MKWQRHNQRGFTLLEMMVVVILIAIMTGAVAVGFLGNRSSMKVKRDAASMVSFMRNMWDRTKTTGTPLILAPDFENGSLAYIDPRDGVAEVAKFTSDAYVLAIKLNDRLYSEASVDQPIGDGLYADEFFDTSIYLGEGRGLSLVAVIFGVPRDEENLAEGFDDLTMCELNLITGKGKITELEEADLHDIFDEAAAAELENEI